MDSIKILAPFNSNIEDSSHPINTGIIYTIGKYEYLVAVTNGKIIIDKRLPGSYGVISSHTIQ